MAKSDDKVSAELISLAGDMSMALGGNLKIYAQMQEASKGTVKAFDDITEKVFNLSAGFDDTIKNITENISPDAISSKIIDITSTTDTEQKPPILPTSPIPVAAKSPALPINDRETKKSFLAQAAEDQVDVLEDRLPASGFWKHLLEAVRGNKPGEGGKGGGGGGGLLSSLLGMLGNLAGIGTILGVFAAIAGIATLIGAIATDAPVMSGLRAIFQAIGKFAFVISKLAIYGKDFVKAFAKTGSFADALKVAGKGGEIFPTITKYLTLIGSHIDGLFDAFKGLPPVLKGVSRHTGTFAKMLPRLGGMVFKGPLVFLPLIGTIVQFGFAAYRFARGDWIGGAIDLCGGVLSLMGDILAGVGSIGGFASFGVTAAVGWSLYAVLNMMSLGLGVLNFYLDHKAGGMTRTSEGLSVQPQKAAMLVKLAKGALGRAALGVLGTVFGPILQVVGGLKLIAEGELMKGLSMMTTLDPRFNDVLSLLGMEPEDLGLTQKQVDQQQGFATGIGKTMLKELGKMLLLPFTTLFAAPLAIGQILFTIAKGGSVKDGLIELSHWLPFVKPLTEFFNIESMQSEAPAFGDVSAADMITNLYDFFHTNLTDSLLWILDKAIEWSMDAFFAKKRLQAWISKGIKSSINWIKDKMADLLIGFVPLWDAIMDIVSAPFSLENWSKLFIEISISTDKFFKWIDDGWKGFKDWWSKLSIWDSLKTFYNDVSDGIDKIAEREKNKVIAWIEKKIQYIRDRLTKGRSWGFLKDIFNAIECGFHQVLKDFIGYLRKSFVDFSSWMDRTYVQFKTDLVSWWDMLYGSVTTFIYDINNKLEIELDHHKKKIEKLMELPRKIWSGFIDKVTKSIETAANSAATTIDNTLTDATTAFDDMMKCITDTFPEIVDFVCNMAKSVREFFDKNLKRVKGILNIGDVIADKAGDIAAAAVKPMAGRQKWEAITTIWNETGDALAVGVNKVSGAIRGLFKRSPWTWDILHEAGDALAQGAGKVVHSAVRLKGMVEKTFNLNLDSIASTFFASIPNKIRNGVMDYVEAVVSSFKGAFAGTIDKDTVVQKLIAPIAKANLDLFDAVAPNVKRATEILTDPLKTAGDAINKTVGDVTKIAQGLGLDITTLGDISDEKLQQGIREMSRLMSTPTQVEVSDLKPIDITINGDQFDKLITAQLKTYDVLNVQISKILTDINDSIQNIEINEGGVIPIPQEEQGYVGEATNASYNDRLMNRTA